MEGLWLDRYVVGGTVSIAIVKVVSVKVLSPSEVQTDYMGLGGALARMGLGPREMEIKMLSNWIEIPFQVEAKKESSVRKKTATDP
jgi:hypothetical protein